MSFPRTTKSSSFSHFSPLQFSIDIFHSFDLKMAFLPLSHKTKTCEKLISSLQRSACLSLFSRFVQLRAAWRHSCGYFIEQGFFFRNEYLLRQWRQVCLALNCLISFHFVLDAIPTVLLVYSGVFLQQNLVNVFLCSIQHFITWIQAKTKYICCSYKSNDKSIHETKRELNIGHLENVENTFSLCIRNIFIWWRIEGCVSANVKVPFLLK